MSLSSYRSSRRKRLITLGSNQEISVWEGLEPRVLLAAHIGTMTYPTIQAAVIAALPGQTITVDPGVYNESVLVAKSSITIDGAQAGVDARFRSGSPASESIVQGPGGSTAFTFAGDDDKLDGFTVQNATNPAAFGAALYIRPGFSGTQILNNIVQDSIVGLFVSNSSPTDQTKVLRNLFRDNTQPGPASGTDIYADNFTAGVGVQNILIQSNTFTNTTFAEDSWGIGISNVSPVPFTNIQVVDNLFTKSGRGMYFFSTANSTVQHNIFFGATHYAIGLFGGDSGLSISCNDIIHNGTGIFVEDDLGTPNSNITVNMNNIVGNTVAGVHLSNMGVTPVAYAGTMDATYNWWGSPTGPTNPANPHGTGDAVITDPGAGSVDFTPWLRSPSTCAPGSQEQDDDDEGQHNGEGDERDGRREMEDHNACDCQERD